MSIVRTMPFGGLEPWHDRTPDTNSKTITTPAGLAWILEGITVDVRTSGAVGARTFWLAFYLPVGDDVPLYQAPPLALTAGQAGFLLCSPGVSVYGTAWAAYDKVSLCPLPFKYWPEFYRIKVWDSLAFSALDDIRIEINRQEVAYEY